MFFPSFFVFEVHEIQLRPMKGGSLVPETAFSSDTWYLQIRYRTNLLVWLFHYRWWFGSEIGRALVEVGGFLTSQVVFSPDSTPSTVWTGFAMNVPCFFFGGWTKHQSFGLKIMVFFHLFFFCGSFKPGTLIANLVWAKKRKPLQFSKPRWSTLR